MFFLYVFKSNTKYVFDNNMMYGVLFIYILLFYYVLL